LGLIRARVAASEIDFTSTPAAKITNRRRRISPESGRALEILGHAIEYLTDEYIQSEKQVSAHDPDVEAVQLLMALNRKVYYECPESPTLTERLRAFGAYVQ